MSANGRDEKESWIGHSRVLFLRSTYTKIHTAAVTSKIPWRTADWPAKSLTVESRHCAVMRISRAARGGRQGP